MNSKLTERAVSDSSGTHEALQFDGAPGVPRTGAIACTGFLFALRHAVSESRILTELCAQEFTCVLYGVLSIRVLRLWFVALASPTGHQLVHTKRIEFSSVWVKDPRIWSVHAAPPRHKKRRNRNRPVVCSFVGATEQFTHRRIVVSILETTTTSWKARELRHSDQQRDAKQ